MKEIVYQVTIDQHGAQPKFEYQWDTNRARQIRWLLTEGVTQIKASK